MAVTAAQVKELREKTGAGMLDCKNALAASDGDMDKAVDWLREKGIAKSVKKANRIAAEGLSKVVVDGNKAVIVEVNSETDFVAKNEQFLNLLDTVAKTILASDAKTNEEALALTAGDKTLNDLFVEATATIGEKIVLRRFVVLTKNDDEIFGDYMHNGGAKSTVVVMKGSNAELAHYIAMQVASMAPTYVSSADLPKDVVEHETSIQTEIVKNDPKNASKPEAIIAKMVEGKVSKALKEIDVYQASLEDLKAKTLKEYQDTKAPALFDVAGNNKKAANAYQGKVTDKMNSLSSIINKKANDLYAAKFTEGLAKSVTERKAELDKVVYDKKTVTSAFTDVQKVIDEITALAADKVNLMINLDTQILDKIQNAEDAKLIDKATAKALNDDYSAKLSELEADAKAKETEMAAFVHADRDKDLDAFKKKVTASVGEAKKKVAAEDLALTNYAAVKADFAKYAEAKDVYDDAKNADGIAKANDVIRKELAPKFTELDTNLAAAEKYYLAYFFDTSALKSASKAIGIEINATKAELEKARVDQLNKSDYEVAIAAYAKRIEALYESANTTEKTAISVAITGIQTDKEQAVEDFTTAGETEKAAEVEKFFETNCKDLGTEFGKLELPEGLAEIQATYIEWEQKVAKAHAGIINLWKADLTESTYKTLVQNFDVVKAEYDKLANIVATGHEPVKKAYADKACTKQFKTSELKDAFIKRAVVCVDANYFIPVSYAEASKIGSVNYVSTTGSGESLKTVLIKLAAVAD